MYAQFQSNLFVPHCNVAVVRFVVERDASNSDMLPSILEETVSSLDQYSHCFVLNLPCSDRPSR